jgi:hypothetical protein
VVDQPSRRLGEDDPFATKAERRRSVVERRREKIVAEIERNRRGDHRVPTWVLVLAIVVVVAAWLALILLA